MAEKNLPAQQKKLRAPDNNIRIGLGHADGSVTVQGQTINAGFIFGCDFGDNEPVVLLRQDKSWFCLGAVRANFSAAVGIQAGVQLMSGSAVTSAFTDIVFMHPYPAGVVPSVVGSISTNAGVVGSWDFKGAFVSNTGFRLNINSLTGAAATFSNVPVSWMAHPPTQ